MYMLNKFPHIILFNISFFIVGNSEAAFGQFTPQKCQSERVKLQMLGTWGSDTRLSHKNLT